MKKLDYKPIVETLKNFSINFSVGSFLLGIFEKSSLGMIVGAIFASVSLICSIKWRNK